MTETLCWLKSKKCVIEIEFVMLMRCMGKTQEKELKVKLLLNIHFVLTCILHILYQIASLLCNSGSSFTYFSR